VSACFAGLDMTLNRGPTNRSRLVDAVLVPTMTNRDTEFSATTGPNEYGRTL
jgi:hypothetical protein